MSDKALLGAADIAEILGVFKSKAYTIIREGNQELKSMHKLVISGKLPVEYFNDICYSSKSKRDEEGSWSYWQVLH